MDCTLGGEQGICAALPSVPDYGMSPLPQGRLALPLRLFLTFKLLPKGLQRTVTNFKMFSNGSATVGGQSPTREGGKIGFDRLANFANLPMQPLLVHSSRFISKRQGREFTKVLARRSNMEICSGSDVDRSGWEETLATRKNCSVRKVNMTISLAFLAPGLVKAAIQGRLPRGIGIARLSDLPSDWSKQI